MKVILSFKNRLSLRSEAVFLLLLGLSTGLLASKATAQVTFSVQPDTAHRRVEIRANDQPFTAYIYPESIKKPVLYPLLTSQGAVLTRGFPLDTQPNERVDHPHHIGMWLNYGNVDGYDFWNNSEAVDPAEKYGTIYHREIVEATGGKQGTLHVTADWVTSAGDSVLEEDTRFVFVAQGKDTYFIDRITTLTATNGKVSLSDNKEGMLGIRVSRALELPSDKPAIVTDTDGNPAKEATVNNDGVNGHYRSSEGIEDAQVWGTRARWMQLSGQVAQQPSAIVILDHPDNVGFPTYWHARGYGLFAANPLGQEPLSEGKDTLNFTLEKGKSVTFRYRVVVHAGSPLDDKVIESIYRDFSHQEQP